MVDTSTATHQDPIREASGTLDLVTRAARNGAADAKEAATKFWNGTGLFLCRFVYTTSYTLSYGIVFPSVLIARSIPKNNPIVQGMMDGAHAATEKVAEIRHPKPATHLIIPHA